MYEYKTQGTCSSKITFDIRDNKVYGLSFTDGCNGNLSGISILAEGMEAAELIKRLKGVRCGSKKTSCPDQLAKALERAVKAS
ncbi:TIGR03905 family TSCPD domain-containing protein [Treponema primitia]|uniref:TIGR03905 family TSCPD domain-containing protein n=1 Tax=Treponema primitia TaxID=88058 RepID=UPI0002554CB5|nr:TIGR03905 family TSCPD domain-containing protein [Treponema primitia]